MEPLLPLIEEGPFDPALKARAVRAQEQLGFELWSTFANDPRWLDASGNPLPVLLVGGDVMIVNEPLPGGRSLRYQCRVLDRCIVGSVERNSVDVEALWQNRKLWYQANQTYQSLLRAMIAVFDKHRHSPELPDPTVVARKDRLQRVMRKAHRRVARRQARVG